MAYPAKRLDRLRALAKVGDAHAKLVGELELGRVALFAGAELVRRGGDLDAVVDDRPALGLARQVLRPGAQLAHQEREQRQSAVATGAISVVPVHVVGDEEIHHGADVIIVDQVEVGHEPTADPVDAGEEPVHGLTDQVSQQGSGDLLQVAEGNRIDDAHVDRFDLVVGAPFADDVACSVAESLRNPDAVLTITPGAAVRLDRGVAVGENGYQDGCVELLDGVPMHAVTHHRGCVSEDLGFAEAVHLQRW